MRRLHTVWSPHIDLVASQLRTQIATLQKILTTIEETQNFKSDFILEDLKKVEINIKGLRKFISE